jgi:multiple sugar transport system permease protein
MTRRAAGWMYIPLLLWTVFVIAPLWWIIVTSLKDLAAITNGPTYLPFIDFQPVLSAWHDAFIGDQTVWGPLRNSLIIGFCSTTLAVILGTLAAYGLARYRLKAGPVRNNDIMFWIVSQNMMPPIVTALAFFFLFKQFHLLDTQLGMILGYMVFNLPVVVWFMHSFINQVPLALEEAAVIDGCTRLQVLTRVVLPVSIPGLVATWLLAFSFAWNEFLFAVILTFNKATTLPVLIQAQQTERGTAWWAISSIALVSIIPMIVFAIILQRRIVTGLLGGSER